MSVNKRIQKCVSILGIMTLLFTSSPIYAGEVEESTAYETEAVTGNAAETGEAEEVIEELVVEPEAEEDTEEIAEEEESLTVEEEETETAEEESEKSLQDTKEAETTEKNTIVSGLCFDMIPVPSKPVFSEVKCSSYNSVSLRWNMVDSTTYPANGYKIYRSTDQENYKLIADIDEFGDYLKGKSEPFPNAQFEIENGSVVFYYTYTDKSLSTGTTYYYKLMAYNYNCAKTGTTPTKKNSKYSSVKSAKPIMNKPTLKVTNGNKSELKLTWSKIPGANGYVIQRSTKIDGEYSTIKTITNGSTVTYTNSNLTLGKTYYYRVRAYRTVSSKKVYSSYSAKKSLKVK